ncbi:MAG: LuxR C-terminal-related transcriptional regulator [Candidatus Sericytochromatia bacterium]
MIDIINNKKIKLPEINYKNIFINKIESLLDISDNKSLIVLRAGIGFGKTSSIVNWIKKRNKLVAWVSLDKYDNNIKNLFTYLVTSVRNNIYPNFFKDFESNLIKLDTLQIINLLFREFILLKHINFKIVIDNFEIITNSEILDYFSYLIQYLPDNTNIYILTKNKKTINLDINTYNKILFIEQTNFLLNLDDIKIFYLKNDDLKLSKNEIYEIYSLTEGWGLGLEICYLYLNKKNKISYYYNKNENFSKYITLLNKILFFDEKTKYFLLKLSLLDKFNYNLCNLINNITNSQNILNELYNNYLIENIDNISNFYKINNLFSKILFTIFNKEIPNLEQEILEISISFYTKMNMYNELLEQYLKLKNYKKIVDVINKAEENNYYIENIYKYLKHVDINDIINNEKVANLYIKDLLFNNIIIKAESFLNKILKIKKYDYFEIYKAQIELSKNNREYAINIFMNFLDHENEDLVVRACNFLSNTLSDNSEIRKSFIIIHKRLEKIKNIENKIKMLNYYVIHLREILEIKKAKLFIKNAIKDIFDNSLELKMNDALIKFISDEIHLELLIGKNNSDFYIKKIAYMNSLINNENIYTESYSLYISLYFNIINYKFFEAEEIIIKLELMNNSIIKNIIDYYNNLLFIFKEDKEKLKNISNKSFNAIKTKNCLNQSVMNITILSFITLEDYKKVEEIINIFESIIIDKYTLVYLEYLIFKSVFEYKSKVNTYLDNLLEAVNIASKIDIIGIFLYLPKKILNILNLIINELYKNMLNKLNKFEKYQIDYVKFLQEAISNKIDENNLNLNLLSNRETEIIKMMYKGLSNKEIALNMYISLNTLKVHLNNIYKKMCVKNKKDALIFAIANNII